MSCLDRDGRVGERAVKKYYRTDILAVASLVECGHVQTQRAVVDLERFVSETPVPELVDSGDSVVDLDITNGEPESRSQHAL